MQPGHATQAFRRAFAHRHVVLPVIHVESESQALENTQLASEAGADGVFLINHSFSSTRLLEIYDVVVQRFGDFWLGLNCLGDRPVDVFGMIPEGVGGIWVDNAMIDERGEDQQRATSVLEARKRSGREQTLYFGGVAFKYQRQVDDLAAAAQKASHLMDVVTTSGAGTGRAAHVEKIRTMKQALGTFPLAIASGITPDNIKEYLPYSDCYLVATGISKSFTELDEGLLRQLLTLVRSHDENP